MVDLYHEVYNKYCPNCQKRNKSTDKYCHICHWWLGNVPAKRENLYELIRQDNKEMEEEKRLKELQNMKPAPDFLVRERMKYKYTTEEYNKDMFWYHFIENFWWVLLLLCIISPIFNGGFLLIVISIALVIYAIYKMFIIEDKYDSHRR
jgi:hypothetical protein